MRGKAPALRAGGLAASRQLPLGHFQHVAEVPLGGQHGGRLEAAVHQAMLAAGIVARAQRLPVGVRRAIPGSSRSGRR